MTRYDHVPFRDRLPGILASWILAIVFAGILALLGAPTWGWAAAGVLARFILTAGSRAEWLAAELDARRKADR